MCFSTRESQGGSIAVLRSTQEPAQSIVSDEMQLLFSNPGDDQVYCGTEVEFKGWSQCNQFQRDRYWVMIHHYGDLTVPVPNVPLPHLAENSFFSFSVDSKPKAMRLPQRLDLSVGNTGIVGRRVTVMANLARGPTTLAEGIIGWN